MNRENSTHHPDYRIQISTPEDVRNDRTVEGDAGPTTEQVNGRGTRRTPNPQIDINI